MSNHRFVKGAWCNICKKRAGIFLCHRCGASWSGHDPFKSIKQVWVVPQKVWWNPWTWFGRWEDADE